MATVSLTLDDTVIWSNSGPQGGAYADVQSATASGYMAHNSENITIGQSLSGFPNYLVYRSAVRFDISTISQDAVITAATLKLYGFDDDSTDDFDITVVDGSFQTAPLYTDYSKGETTSFGAINSSACSVGAYNDITINADGLAALNTALSTGIIELYLRNNFDIAATAPTTLERYQFRGYDHASQPQLDITYFILGEDVYPTAVSFPLAGSIDLATYSTIKNYLEGIDADLALTTDGDGNVDLAVANYIWWTGTSEILGYDNSTSHVTVTTLEATSGLTLDCDLVTADPTITTTGTAVDSTVATDALLSNTAHASIKAKITDNEIAFDAISAPSPADDEADIYMDSTSGDLVIKTRDDGQAGVKTDLLGDFSGM